MPNFARILINIFLYIFYTVSIAFIFGFIIPIISISIGYNIPRFDKEVYDMMFYALAGTVFLITFICRRSCYMKLKKTEKNTQNTQKQDPKKDSYTQKKKELGEKKGTDEEMEIYIAKEIK